MGAGRRTRPAQPDTIQKLTDVALDYPQARRAYASVTLAKHNAEIALADAFETAAKSDAHYHKTRAEAIVKERADNTPATLAPRTADGREEVVQARIEMNVDAGMVEAWKERLKTLEGERAALHRLVEWSMKVAPTGQVDY